MSDTTINVMSREPIACVRQGVHQSEVALPLADKLIDMKLAVPPAVDGWQ